jgi:hypothetical protein
MKEIHENHESHFEIHLLCSEFSTIFYFTSSSPFSCPFLREGTKLPYKIGMTIYSKKKNKPSFLSQSFRLIFMFVSR